MTDEQLQILTEKMKAAMFYHPPIWMIVVHGIGLALFLLLCMLFWYITQ